MVNCKKIVFLYVIVCMMVLGGMIVTADSEISVRMNGRDLIFDQNPVIENGRTLIPLRGVFEQLGAKVEWEPSTRSVIASNQDVTVILELDNPSAMVNGQEVVLDVAPKILNDRTVVPLRFVGESFGEKVLWVKETNQVIVGENEKGSMFFEGYRKKVDEFSAQLLEKDSLIRELYNKTEKEPYTSNFSILPSVSTDDDELLEQGWVDVINELAAYIQVNADKSSSKESYDIDLKHGGDSLLSALFMKNDDTYIFGVPNIYEKFFSLEGSALEEELRDYRTKNQFNVYQNFIVNAIENGFMEDFFELEGEDLIEIKDRYQNYITNYFSKENFSINHDKVKWVNGEEVKSKKIELKISPQDFEGFIKNLGEMLRNDRLLNKAITKRAANLINSMEKYGLYNRIRLGNEGLSDLVINRYVSSSIDELVEALLDIDFYEDFVLTIYLDEDGNIIKQRGSFGIINSYEVIDRDEYLAKILEFKKSQDGEIDYEELSRIQYPKKQYEDIYSIGFLQSKIKTPGGRFESKFKIDVAADKELIRLGYRRFGEVSDHSGEQSEYKIECYLESFSDDVLDFRALLEMDMRALHIEDNNIKVYEILDGKFTLVEYFPWMDEYEELLSINFPYIHYKQWSDSLSVGFYLGFDFNGTDYEISDNYVDDVAVRGNVTYALEKDERSMLYDENLNISFGYSDSDVGFDIGLNVEGLYDFNNAPQFRNMSPDSIYNILEMTRDEELKLEREIEDAIQKYLEELVATEVGVLYLEHLLNSKKDADQKQARNIERAIQTLVAETGVSDIVGNKYRFKLEPSEDALSVIEGEGHTDGVMPLIKGLQNVIYVRDRATGRWMAFGPYLHDPTPEHLKLYSSYAPSWNTGVGGEYVGYEIIIDKNTRNVHVNLAKASNHEEKSKAYNPDEKVDYKNSRIIIRR